MTNPASPNLNSPDTAGSAQPRLLVLGLGNDILSDDAIGLLVVGRLESLLGKLLPVDFCATTEMGLALLDFMAGYDSVFIVDSILTGEAEPGTIHCVEHGSTAPGTRRTPHFLGLSDTLALGVALHIPMPRCVRVFAIEVEDPFKLGTALSPRLRTAFDTIIGQISAAIHGWVAPPLPPPPALSPEARA